MQMQHSLVCAADMKIIQVEYLFNTSEGKINVKNIKLIEDCENFNIDFIAVV